LLLILSSMRTPLATLLYTSVPDFIVARRFEFSRANYTLLTVKILNSLDFHRCGIFSRDFFIPF